MLKEYEINGMYCSNCAYRIEKRVKNKYNCDAYVDLINNKLYVESLDIDESDLVKTITKMGYQVNKQNKHWNIIISIIMLILLMIIAMGPMFNLSLPLSIVEQIIIQWVLTTIIYACYYRFLISGFKSLITGDFKMDSLIFISGSSAYLYSLYLGISYLIKPAHHFHLYFETGAMILVIIGIGKYLEAISKKRTGSDLVKLVNATPQKASVLVDNQIIEKSIYDIEVGDILIVKVGEKIALDGIIVLGESNFDESLLTGESRPIYKKQNDQVFGSSLNLGNPVQVKVTSNFSNGLLGQIISMSKSAQMNKLNISNISDNIAKIFVPTIIIIAFITFVVWLFIGSLEQAFNHMLSVLVISCPCAMGLATPSALSVGLGIAYRNGILIKNSEIIERLVKVKSFIFDKTGTLTNNSLELITYNLPEEEINIVYSIEHQSSHPIAKMITSQLNATLIEIQSIEELVGRGLVAEINQHRYLIGNAKLLKEYDIAFSNADLIKYVESGYNFILVAKDDTLIGYFVFSEQIKNNAKELIEYLNKKRITSLICSGDSEKAVASIAEQLKISKYYASILPSDKANIVNELAANKTLVAMVGDGINDAIALNSADVSISFFNGSDLAINSGDCILMNNNLLDIKKLLEISIATINKIKQNLFWALFYNSFLIPIAAGCFSGFGVELNPMYGAVIMSFSSIFVVFNALSIRRKFK